jgi:hypothetical protein
VESVSFHVCFGQLNPRKKLLKTWNHRGERTSRPALQKDIRSFIYIMWGSVNNPCFGEINPRIKPFSLLKPWKIISVAKKYAKLYFRHSSVLVQGERASTPQRYQVNYTVYYVERELINPYVSAA